MIINAKTPGTCARCGKPFAAGDEIEYWRHSPPLHAACSNSPAPTPAEHGPAAYPPPNTGIHFRPKKTPTSK